MMKVCEKFPQIGTIRDYMALPLGERVIYDQFTIDAIQAEAKTPIIKLGK